MTGFPERMRRENRAQLLRLLNVDPETAWNLYILRGAMEDVGRSVTVTDVEMGDWLAAAGLVRHVSRRTPATLRITSRGIRVVEGAIAVAGVAGPPR